MKLLQNLVKIANQLDQLGLTEEANTIDGIISKLAADDFGSLKNALEDKLNSTSVYTYIEELGNRAQHLDLNLQGIKNSVGGGPSQELHAQLRHGVKLLTDFIKDQQRLKNSSADKNEEEELIKQNTEIKSMLERLDKSF